MMKNDGCTNLVLSDTLIGLISLDPAIWGFRLVGVATPRRALRHSQVRFQAIVRVRDGEIRPQFVWQKKTLVNMN